MCYSPSALGETNTASSANAKKNICKVAISKTNRLCDVILFISKYYSK